MLISPRAWRLMMDYCNEQERLVAEQAVLGYRAVMAAMEQAPWGRGLEVVERAVLEQGREQQRRVLEQAMEAATQKRMRPAAARGAKGELSSSSAANGT